MSRGEMIAKARFARLVNCNPLDLVLARLSGPEGDVYSLQLMQRDPDGRQYTLPLGTIYSDDPEGE